MITRSFCDVTLQNVFAIFCQLLLVLVFASVSWLRLYLELEASTPGDGFRFLGFRREEDLGETLVSISPGIPTPGLNPWPLHKLAPLSTCAALL